MRAVLTTTISEFAMVLTTLKLLNCHRTESITGILAHTTASLSIGIAAINIPSRPPPWLLYNTACSPLPWYAVYSLNAFQYRILWRNLMERCELRRSRSGRKPLNTDKQARPSKCINPLMPTAAVKFARSCIALSMSTRLPLPFHSSRGWNRYGNTCVLIRASYLCCITKWLNCVD